MKKYIDVDLLKSELEDLDESGRLYYMGVFDVINSQPTADVKRIVKCEKCKYARFQYNTDKYPFGVYACEKQPAGRAYKKVRGNFFCAYGTRTDKDWSDTE